MATFLPDAYRNSICIQLSQSIGAAIQNGELDETDISECAGSIVAAINSITSYEQMIDFLRKLSFTWPFLATIAESTYKHLLSQQDVDKMFVGRAIAP